MAYRWLGEELDDSVGELVVGAFARDVEEIGVLLQDTDVSTVYNGAACSTLFLKILGTRVYKDPSGKLCDHATNIVVSNDTTHPFPSLRLSMTYHFVL